MARAHWSYRGYTFGANVAFSTRAIADNFKREGRHNYLASSQAKAVFFIFMGEAPPLQVLIQPTP